MIRPPSNQKPYDEYWSGDPALLQPPEDDDPVSNGLRIEYAEKLKRCRQTGSWSELIVAGETPTKFIMQPIKGEQVRWFHDQATISDPSKALRDGVALSYAFRCAILDITNTGSPDFKMEFVDHPHLGRIAASSVTNYLDAIDRSIVSELGARALLRAQNLDPL